MAITIRGEAGERIRVAGDIEAVLKLPYDDVEERFFLASSDGTLIVGEYDEDRRYRFRTEVEGAGLTRITREGENDTVVLDWRVEWVTISPYWSGRVAGADQEEQPQPMLSLFEVAEKLQAIRPPEASLAAELGDEIPW